jgi:hypothetical protein
MWGARVTIANSSSKKYADIIQSIANGDIRPDLKYYQHE